MHAIQHLRLTTFAPALVLLGEPLLVFWHGLLRFGQIVLGQLGARVNVNDFIGRESRALADGGTFATGKYRFRYSTLPICPTAGTLASFEEAERTLLCSDLFKKSGVSIAMGNASREVQASATCAPSSNEHEGFAKAIEEFVLTSRAAKA